MQKERGEKEGRRWIIVSCPVGRTTAYKHETYTENESCTAWLVGLFRSTLVLSQSSDNDMRIH